MNDYTQEELRRLVARLDPRVMPPHRAAEELARVRLENPALADAARRFLDELGRLCDEMLSLSPSDQRQRLLRVEDADLAAMLAEQLRLTGPGIVLPDNSPLPSEAFQSVPSRYTIRREIGFGGMAVVYLAHDSQVGRNVALKVACGAASSEDRARFQREAAAVARLNHANIVQIFDVGEHQGRQYLSLEYCTGGTLAEFLAREPVTARGAAGLIQTLARAVQVAHDAGIIHRDLKPANVLLQEPAVAVQTPTSAGKTTVVFRQSQSTPKIADFGLARFLDGSGLTQEGMIAGTPWYMAPEQASAANDLGPAVDIYALGAILYECLTRRPPFTGSMTAVLQQVRESDPISPRQLDRNVPADIEAVCLKCLEKNPSKRYASAEALADDLGRFLDGHPTLARPLTPFGRAWKGFRRKPKTFSFTTVALLLVAGAIFYGANANAARVEQKQLDEKKLRDLDLSAALERANLLEKSIQEEKRHRHDDSVATARKLAERGNWKDALPIYDEAIARHQPDRADLEVERIPGWLLMKDTPAIQAECARLLALLPQAPAERAALIRLHYGDFLHSDMTRLEEASKFVGEALASGKLSPANAEYARGLLSPQTTAAMASFRKAIALAPVHPRAHHALLLTHLIRGELNETRDRARFIDNLFPDDTVSHLARSFADMMDGEYVRSMAHLDLLDRHCSPQRMKALRAFMSQLHFLHRGFNLEGKNDVQVLANVPAFLRMIQLAQKQDNSTNPFAFNIPVSRWLLVSLNNLMEGAKATVLISLPGEIFVNQAIELLEPICNDHAEPLLHQLLGTAYLKSAHGHNKAKRPKECIEMMEKASTSFRRSAVAPTMAPRTSIRYASLFLALEADGILLMGHAQGDHHLTEERVRELNQRMQSLLPRLLILGREYPETRAELITGRQVPHHIPRSIAFLLTEDWQRDFPDDIRPLKLRIRFAIAQQDWGLSTSLLDELARKSPKDKDLPNWRREVGKKLLAGFKD